MGEPLKACAAVVLAAALGGCDRQRGGTPASPPRAVTVVELAVRDPSVSLRLSGSVEPWKQEDIGFEVPGTLRFVCGENVDVEGRTLDEQGRVITEGTVLASLDRSRYELAVEEAEAEVAAAKAARQATRTEVASVLPAQIKAAEADLDLARNELKRLEDARSRDVATDLEVDRQAATVKVAAADLDRVRAQLEMQQAALTSAGARVSQATEAVKRAELDLHRCDLKAPFPGRVSELYAIPGAYVQPGQGVAQVTMMDPITVAVAVSPATDRLLNIGDAVTVYPPGVGEPVTGFIYSKDTIADRNLRTFKVSLFVRNQQVPAEAPEPEQFLSIVTNPRFAAYTRQDGRWQRLYADERVGPVLRRITSGQARPEDLSGELAGDYKVRRTVFESIAIEDVLPVLVREPSTTRPLYVEVNCLFREEQTGRQFVWKAEGMDMKAPGAAYSPIFRLRKVYVRPKEDRLALLGMYVFREVEADGEAPGGGLEVDDLLALRPPAWVADGDRVMLLRLRWLFRPGDLVKLELGRPGPGAGLYVPMEAILPEAAGGHAAYVVREADGATRVERVPVRITGQVGALRRIASQALAAGDRLVVRGASLLAPGQRVRVVGELDERSLRP